MIAVGFLMAHGPRQRRQAVPRHEVRDRRLLGRRRGHRRGAERRRACSSRSRRRATSSATWPALLTKKAASRAERQEHHLRPSAASRSRRSTGSSPATRRARRRPTPIMTDPERLLQRLRRPGEVQGARRGPDRARARTSCSRSPAAAVWARSRRPARRASGASASTRTSRPRGPQVLTSAVKRVDEAVFLGHQGVAGRHVRRRHRHHLRRGRGRRRPRHRLARRAAGAPRRGRRPGRGDQGGLGRDPDRGPVALERELASPGD